jgi:superfamily II DNA or RNA helicase
LGLTATVERLDGNHVLLVSHAPVVDSISLAEAKANNWISKYLEFNLGIPFTDEEQKTYDRINKLYNKFFKMFGYDFDLAMKCQAGKAKTPGAVDGPTVRRSYAMIMGWDPVKDRDNRQHLWHPDNIAGYAVQFGKYMRERKEIFYNSQSKVNLAKEIHNRFPGAKMITFSESTSFADRVTEEIPDSVSYHSYIEGKTAEVRESKVFKTPEGAKNFCGRNKGKLKSLRRRGTKVTWSKDVKQSPSSVRRSMLQEFTEGKVRVINTARALDQGFNVKDIEVAVIFSRTSNPTQQIQRTGRSARKFTFADGSDKTAIIINVYIKDEPPTQDEKWLRSAQKKSRNVIWTEDIRDISITYNTGHNAAIDGE